MHKLRYPMKYVVQRTGLSPHVLRVWERRYGAVVPERSESNRRLYGEEEVSRLELLTKLTAAGHGIGQIATLPLAELESMTAALPPAAEPTEKVSSSSPQEDLLEQAWSQVVALDPTSLRDLLDKAAVSLGSSGLLEQLMVPLISRIGTGWENGQISVAEEHAASAVIREVLFHTSRPFAESAGAPGLVVATPTGQLHELGAALVSSIARRLGWSLTYLGPSLPAEEIARGVARSGALAVALSIVYPADDPQLADELRRLRKLLPTGLPILVGGRAASAYDTALGEIDAIACPDLSSFSAELDQLRKQRALSAAAV